MGTKKRTKRAVAKRAAPKASQARSHQTAVLLMAYGSAPTHNEEGVRAYLDHILAYYRGAAASDEQVADLKARYERIGESPLYGVTGRLARAVQQRLSKPGEPYSVRVAMKHSPPFIEDAVKATVESGVTSGIAVALAPFRSRLTSDSYYKQVDAALVGDSVAWTHPGDWHQHPLFLVLWERLVAEAIEAEDDDPVVIFTNHSLPARILSWNDPFPEQFSATANALAERLELERWSIAFQSAGGGGQPWLGPSLFDVVGQWIDRGARAFVVAPIGFLVDHLEVRYDLDIDAVEMAKELGVSIRRTAMPNDAPEMVELVADLVLTVSSERQVVSGG